MANRSLSLDRGAPMTAMGIQPRVRGVLTTLMSCMTRDHDRDFCDTKL